MAKLLFPFILGLILVLAQPIIDMVCEDALIKNRAEPKAIEAARWAGSTAAFLPAAVLTVYGAVLVMWDEGHADGDWILIGAVSLLVACFLILLFTLSRGGPAASWRGGIKQFEYTALQLFLAVLNVIGIGLVLWFYFHGTEAPETLPTDR